MKTRIGTLKQKQNERKTNSPKPIESGKSRESTPAGSGTSRQSSPGRLKEGSPDGMTDENGVKYLGTQRKEGYIPGQITPRPGVKSNEEFFQYKNNPAPGKSTNVDTDVYSIKGERIPPWYLKEKRRR